MLDNLAKVTSWTGGGLHAETNPAQNHPPSCNVVWKLEGTTYKRVDPATGFDCNKDKYILKVVGDPDLDAIKLDANRIARQYSGG